jgi:hypothetical protein
VSDAYLQMLIASTGIQRENGQFLIGTRALLERKVR